MTFTPIGAGQTKAYRIAKALWSAYTFWTADPLKPGEKFRIPYLKWTDDGARDAYWLICDLNGIRREG